MHLVTLDENHTVTAVTPIGDVFKLTLLTGTFVVSNQAPNIGQAFDATTQTFAAAPRRRWITKLAFDSRFTLSEAVTLKAMQVFPARDAAETDSDYIARTQVPAQLQVLASRLNMASYMDLDRQDTRDGVIQLETLGLIAPGRALAILDGPIADHEYHPGA